MAHRKETVMPSNYDQREYKFYAPKVLSEAIKREARMLGITELAFIKTAVVNQLKAQGEMWSDVSGSGRGEAAGGGEGGESEAAETVSDGRAIGS